MCLRLAKPDGQGGEWARSTGGTYAKGTNIPGVLVPLETKLGIQ